MAKKFTKLTVKLSILSGAIYATADQGFWKDTDSADQVWNTLYENVCPYFKELPIGELPQIPSTDCIAKGAREYYNKGVMATFDFIREIPSYLLEWTTQGSDYLYNTIQSASTNGSNGTSGQETKTE